MDYAILELLNTEEPRLPSVTVAVLEERIKNHVQFFWTVVAFLVTWLGVGTYLLVDMRGDVKVLLRPQNLAKAASSPNNPKSQALAKKIVADAKNGPPINQTVVQQSASRFIEAAAKDNSAWPVATDLVSYRTIFNSDLLEVGTAEQLATTPGYVEGGPTARFYNAPPGLPGPDWSYGGGVPLEQSAGFGLLPPGNPPLIWPSGPGPGKQVVLGEGGAILLDGMFLRRVVLRKTEVFYNGGPTILEDAIFVNCTFVLKNDPTTRLFALAVLGQSQVKFQPAKQ